MNLINKSKLIQSLTGWMLILGAWVTISALGLINDHILPSPMTVIHATIELYNDPINDLFGNIGFSLTINFAGYIESILLALPVGFLLGLNKRMRQMFDKPINALRFVPITAMGGIFVAISGLTIWTKIHFLSFGIWVYLVPVIVQRMSEVSETHLQMMKTLGATKWQTFIHLQWKYVMSRLSDDIRILVGIGWTYIIVAEMKNMEGGLGSLIFLGEKQSTSGIVYSCIIIIIVIGILQDLLFKQIDRQLYKFKHA